MIPHPPFAVMRNEEHQKVSNLTSFTGRKPPLTPCAFVTRIGKYSGASPCCFAVGLIYLERMKKRDPGVCLVSTNFQRLFLIAVMVAAKFLDDFYYSNKHWAEVGGITLAEINRLEIEFLFRMGFSLHMQREEYDWYAEELHAKVEAEAAKSHTGGPPQKPQQAAMAAPAAHGPMDLDNPRPAGEGGGANAADGGVAAPPHGGLAAPMDAHVVGAYTMERGAIGMGGQVGAAAAPPVGGVPGGGGAVAGAAAGAAGSVPPVGAQGVQGRPGPGGMDWVFC